MSEKLVKSHPKSKFTIYNTDNIARLKERIFNYRRPTLSGKDDDSEIVILQAAITETGNVLIEYLLEKDYDDDFFE